MNVAIVKYNAGNIRSVINALSRLGIEPVLTDDAETLCKADKVLFPGQGEARNAMQYLKGHRLDEVISRVVVGWVGAQRLLVRGYGLVVLLLREMTVTDVMHRLGVTGLVFLLIQHLRCGLELCLRVGVLVLFEERVAEVIMRLVAVLVFLQTAAVVDFSLGIVLLVVLAVAAAYVRCFFLRESA